MKGSGYPFLWRHQSPVETYVHATGSPESEEPGEKKEGEAFLSVTGGHRPNISEAKRPTIEVNYYDSQ